jgi:hypothetical protein
MTEPDPTPTPPAKPAWRRGLGAWIFLLVVALGLTGVFFLARNDGSNAQVGDCLEQSGDNSVSIVDCGKPEAAFTVLGRVGDKTSAEATLSACDPFPDTASTYWESSDGGTGFVLCLGKKT